MSDHVINPLLQVWDILQDNPKYFPAFRKSQLYIKLLAELDLLKEGATRLDDCDNGSDIIEPSFVL